MGFWAGIWARFLDGFFGVSLHFWGVFLVGFGRVFWRGFLGSDAAQIDHYIALK